MMPDTLTNVQFILGMEKVEAAPRIKPGIDPAKDDEDISDEDTYEEWNEEDFGDGPADEDYYTWDELEDEDEEKN